MVLKEYTRNSKRLSSLLLRLLTEAVYLCPPLHLQEELRVLQLQLLLLFVPAALLGFDLLSHFVKGVFLGLLQFSHRIRLVFTDVLQVTYLNGDTQQRMSYALKICLRSTSPNTIQNLLLCFIPYIHIKFLS